MFFFGFEIFSFWFSSMKLDIFVSALLNLIGIKKYFKYCILPLIYQLSLQDILFPAYLSFDIAEINNKNFLKDLLRLCLLDLL